MNVTIVILLYNVYVILHKININEIINIHIFLVPVIL